MSREEAENLVQQTVARISEHFDAVQIMATWQENGMSACFNSGAGNWYARVGMAREFLMTDQAHTAADEIRQVLPPPDDGEGWRHDPD